MTKQKTIEKINTLFGSVTNFFKWLGYPNPKQSAYSLSKSKKVSNSLLKLLDGVEAIVDIDIKKQAEIRDSVREIRKEIKLVK